MATNTIANLKIAVRARMQKAATRGLNKARLYLEGKIKEALSIEAPRKRLKDGTYRATTRATPGAPPRKLSGRGRANLSSQMLNDRTAIITDNAKSPRGVPYMVIHERKRAGITHQFVEPTVNREQGRLREIVSEEIRKG